MKNIRPDTSSLTIARALSLSRVLILSCFVIVGAITAVGAAITIAAFPSLLPQLAFAQEIAFANPPVPVDNGVGDQTDPHIASSGNNVYISYTSEVNGASEVLFKRSADGGVTFSNPISLTIPGTYDFL